MKQPTPGCAAPTEQCPFCKATQNGKETPLLRSPDVVGAEDVSSNKQAVSRPSLSSSWVVLGRSGAWMYVFQELQAETLSQWVNITERKIWVPHGAAGHPRLPRTVFVLALKVLGPGKPLSLDKNRMAGKTSSIQDNMHRVWNSSAKIQFTSHAIQPLTVCNSVTLSVFVVVCCHPTGNFETLFITPKEMPFHLATPQPHSSPALIYPLCLWICIYWAFLINASYRR